MCLSFIIPLSAFMDSPDCKQQFCIISAILRGCSTQFPRIDLCLTQADYSFHFFFFFVVSQRQQPPGCCIEEVADTVEGLREGAGGGRERERGRRGEEAWAKREEEGEQVEEEEEESDGRKTGSREATPRCSSVFSGRELSGAHTSLSRPPVLAFLLLLSLG